MCARNPFHLHFVPVSLCRESAHQYYMSGPYHPHALVADCLLPRVDPTSLMSCLYLFHRKIPGQPSFPCRFLLSPQHALLASHYPSQTPTHTVPNLFLRESCREVKTCSNKPICTCRQSNESDHPAAYVSLFPSAAALLAGGPVSDAAGAADGGGWGEGAA